MKPIHPVLFEAQTVRVPEIRFKCNYWDKKKIVHGYQECKKPVWEAANRICSISLNFQRLKMVENE